MILPRSSHVDWEKKKPLELTSQKTSTIVSRTTVVIKRESIGLAAGANGNNSRIYEFFSYFFSFLIGHAEDEY